MERVDEVPLTEEQRLVLTEVTRWETDALQMLGNAAIDIDAAATILRERQLVYDQQLLQAKRYAAQRQLALATICNTLELAPGEWRYDADRGAMVRQEKP